MSSSQAEDASLQDEYRISVVYDTEGEALV